MDPARSHAQFVGTIPEHYDAGLGPVIFAPYADDLAARVRDRVRGGRLLETACGTGLLTRRLVAALPPAVEIVATDLNQAMVDFAKSKAPTSPRLEWRVADAASLPFPDTRFDALVCQFGLMFVPDKTAAFREARRVLRAGGTFLFSVWCRIEENPFACVAHAAIASFFDSRPPTFYQVPFSFHDPAAITDHLAAAGFVDVLLERRSIELVAPSTRSFARGLVEGNPVANSIRDAGIPFEKVVAAVSAALGAESGSEPFRSRMNALVVTARAG